VNFRLLVVALFVLGATAFTSTVASRVGMSQISSAAPLSAGLATPELRSAAIIMSEDGEHETLYEMFDPGWALITLSAYTAVLLKMGGIF